MCIKNLEYLPELPSCFLDHTLFRPRHIMRVLQIRETHRKVCPGVEVNVMAVEERLPHDPCIGQIPLGESRHDRRAVIAVAL